MHSQIAYTLILYRNKFVISSKSSSSTTSSRNFHFQILVFPLWKCYGTCWEWTGYHSMGKKSMYSTTSPTQTSSVPRNLFFHLSGFWIDNSMFAFLRDILPCNIGAWIKWNNMFLVSYIFFKERLLEKMYNVQIRNPNILLDSSLWKKGRIFF